MQTVQMTLDEELVAEVDEAVKTLRTTRLSPGRRYASLWRGSTSESWNAGTERATRRSPSSRASSATGKASRSGLTDAAR